MKLTAKISMSVLLVALLASCGLDNFDEPTSTLKVNVVYNGQKIGLRNRYVTLQAYQQGYELHNSFAMYSSQEGAFTASVFDGDYQITLTNGNGPWVSTRDTLRVTVKGSGEANLEVTPYFTISGANISMNGSTVNASFTINQVVPTAKIAQVLLLVSKTAFVDEGVYVAREVVGADNANVGSMNVSLVLSAANQAEKALYGRIGVKTEGVTEAIYSDIVKLK